MITLMEKPYADSETYAVLCPLVREWFKNKFKELSPPQRFSIMNIHKKENTLISSPTGSGKTLSAFMTILNELIMLAGKQQLENKVYCIYISPLKALANDIEKNLHNPLNEITALAEKKVKGTKKLLDIRVAIRTGDTTASQKASMLKKVPHIMITTPESFAIMLASPKFREKLKQVDWVIVDEIHALASSKRGVQLSLCLERLQYLADVEHHPITRVGLSATVSPLEKVAQFLVGMQDPDLDIFRSCTMIDVQHIKKLDLKVLSPVANLIENDYKKTQDAMYALLDRLIQDHKTTLIFTNTRSATERVVHHLKDRFPKHYTQLVEDGSDASGCANPEMDVRSFVGAHHSSLSKEHRLDIENKLKEGKLKCVVSSTSLELGIDIGYIDLVILLGSPKSVARALQRIGRSGHKLHDISKGRIIVLDRDDLVECSVLLKAAIEKKIDCIAIPEYCLDVLAQEIFGMAVEEPRTIDIIFALVKKSYCYRHLTKKDFLEVIRYLNGQYVSLEDRNVYAKIWFDEQTGMIGKKGKLARVLYMTNIGTIPDESFVTVKIQGSSATFDDKGPYVGKIDEQFLERLKRGDVFVLGGSTYEFLYSQGMTAFVKASMNRAPTVPSWVSETLPLSFDLALEIQKFRRYMDEYFVKRATKEEILNFIHKYLYVDEYGAHAIYDYFSDQYQFSKIPHDKRILIEYFSEEKRKYILFHTLYGRRVNDVLSRVLAFVISRLQHKDVEITINDNGFCIVTTEHIQASKAFKLIKAPDMRKIAELSLDNTEVLGRRFRHCASRAFMILRTYMGKRKTVSRQQLSSRLLISAVKRIGAEFPILKEAKREVLEDLMDIAHAEIIISQIESGRIKIEECFTEMPSPFAFNLVSMGYSDIMKMEDKLEFLRRMHTMVQAKISLVKGKRGLHTDSLIDDSTTRAAVVDENSFDSSDLLESASSDGVISSDASTFNYDTFWNKQTMLAESQQKEKLEHLKMLAWNLKTLPFSLREHVVEIIDGSKHIRQDFVEAFTLYREEIDTHWPPELRDFILEKLRVAGELPRE